MISFGYLKLTLVWPLFAMSVAYEFVHMHVSFMLFWVDVLITQYFQNSPLTEIEYCFKADIVTYRRINMVNLSEITK